MPSVSSHVSIDDKPEQFIRVPVFEPGFWYKLAEAEELVYSC